MPERAAAQEILTIRQVAEYLMVSEKTVYRMLERGELPAARVGSQWRFRRQDIDDWLNQAVHSVERDGKTEVLGSLEPHELAIHPLLAPGNVWLGVTPRSRDDLFALMVQEAAIDAHVNRDQLLKSVIEREEVCSTALLDSAAFPHPRDPRPFRFGVKRVLLASLAEPVDFQDPHGHRPILVAMILARSTQGHLLALSRAIKLFGDAALVSAIARARDAAEAIERIRAAEDAVEKRKGTGRR